MQRLLIEAAVRRDDRAVMAWRQWSSRQDLEAIEPAGRAWLPLVCRNLARLGYDEPDMSTLRSSYQRTWMINERRKGGLVQLLQGLQSVGVEALPLKGMPLALFHYRDLGARAMGDVDLLVHPDQLSTTARVLDQLGWKPSTAWYGERFAPFVHAISWNHPQWLDLDLHWHPFMIDCSRDAVAGLWQRAVDQRMDDLTIRVPDATDMLLLACFHGQKADGQSSGRWIADVLTLVEGEPPIDWGQVSRRARELDLVLPVRDALSLVRREFGVPIPGELIEQLQQVSPSAADRRRYRQQTKPPRRASLREMITTHWWRYRAGGRAAGRRQSPLGFAKYLAMYRRIRHGFPNAGNAPSLPIFPSKRGSVPSPQAGSLRHV